MEEILARFAPISLDEMSGIRLMNRIDTKFVTTMPVLETLLGMALEDYMVQEIDGQRNMRYSTTYYDTVDYDMFYTHQHGHAGRQKIRFRTYVSSNLQFMEVKTKNNHGRTKKKRMQVEGMDFDEEKLQFLAKHLRYDAGTLMPAIHNDFDRITLVNKARTERLTIDFNVSFHNYETNLDRDTGNIVIIELKRDGNIFSPITNILRDLHIHPTGFSKCCIGMAMTDPHLKQNNFKQKLRLLQKINADETYRIRPYEDDVY